MTHREHEQLREIYASMVEATIKLGDMIIFASHELSAEDAHHTALERSSKGAANDQRSV